jgi:hypothetical protein
VAYLRPGPFSKTSEDVNPVDPTPVIEFIDEAFTNFIDKQATQLILDLRDNPGDNGSFTDPIIGWFADQTNGNEISPSGQPARLPAKMSILSVTCVKISLMQSA